MVGVIVLSKLGFAQFDIEDQRMLEVLASHAAVAFQNANLLQAERQAARASNALLGLSQALTGRRNVGDILQEALEVIPSIVSCSAIGAYVRDETTGDFRLARLLAVDDEVVRPRAEIGDVPAAIAEPFLRSDTEPFIVGVEAAVEVPRGLHVVDVPREVLVAPLRWDPDAIGALALIAERPDAGFSHRDVQLARGIADITSLALGNARRLTELERFHELVESLDAIFWEADATTLELTFLGGRPAAVLGADAATWPENGRRWGDHVVEDDRDAAIAACRGAIADAQDRHLEYRVRSPAGDMVWVRDLVHVVGGAQVPVSSGVSWSTSPSASWPSRRFCRPSGSTSKRSGGSVKRPSVSVRSTT